MTWTTPSHEFRAPYVMNNLGLWLIRMSLSRELKALDAINNLRLWVTWATLGRELTTLDIMKNSGYWKIWTNQDPLSLNLYMLWKNQGYRWYKRF